MGTIRQLVTPVEGSTDRKEYRRGPAAADLLWAAFDMLLSWMEIARQRRFLQMLDDRLLQDVGLSRADVEAETSKPFWRV